MVETGGYNRGPFIDSANAFCRVPMGSSYCAAGPSLILFRIGVKHPKIRSARAKAWITSESISATDVFFGRAEIPDDCAVVFTRPGGGHLGLRISSTPSRVQALFTHMNSGMQVFLRTFEFNTSPGYRGSQYNGRWSGYRTRDLRAALSPLNAFRIVAFTPILT